MTTAALKRATVSWRKGGSWPLNPLHQRAPPILSIVSGMWRPLGGGGRWGKKRQIQGRPRGEKNDKYKGDLIIEKATGKSVSPPQWENENEEEEVREEEVMVAMADVRVE
jgi:hypothetical protein